MYQDGIPPGYYQDEYMEQEDEWEREGLLDPAWEKQQKKVLVKRNRTTFISTLKSVDPKYSQ